MIRLLLRILLWSAATLAAVLFAVGIALAIGIPVNLEPFRQPAEAAASQALGRQVELAGPIELVPAFYPTFEIRDVRIANPPEWSSESGKDTFARLGLARLEVGMLPLLWGRVTVEIRIEDVELLLETAADGRESWRFAPPTEAADQAPESAQEAVGVATSDLIRRWVDDVELESLALGNIRVIRRDARRGLDDSFVIDEVTGSGATDAPVLLSMRGSLVEYPYVLQMDAGSLRGLFVDSKEAWPFEFSLEIAKTKLHVAATADAPLLAAETVDELTAGEGRIGAIELRVEGERLDHLNELAAVSLPRWGPWSFEGNFTADKGGHYDADVEVAVGSSGLAGKMGLDLSGSRPRVDLRLDSKTIQLDDFGLGDWSPEMASETPADPAPADPAPAEAAADPAPADDSEATRKAAALLSPETLARLDAKLQVKVGRVLSGRDRLGSSHLKASLENGVLAIEPWQVQVPGGEVAIEASLQPTAHEIRTRLAARISRFDYGILMRRIDPETDMGGLLYLDLDLESRAPDLERLMAYANGHLDLGVFPEAFQSGVVDLWSVNLVMAVLPVVDQGENSVLNCGVAGLVVEDGVMTNRSLMMDTSRMRVAGTAKVDFKKERVELELAPKAKRPQFFSLATPVVVDGSFDDFGVGVKAVDLIGTVMRLATSVITVPGRYLVGDILPADGTPDCLAALKRPEP